MTFLAIDVGNTRLKWALYDAHRPGAALIAHGAEFLDHIDRLAESSWAQLPVPTRMLGCVVAGDAAKRRVQEQMEQMVRWDVEPQWVVSSAEEAGLTNGYDHPSRLGSDRWVAMVGARHHVLARGPARPLVVVMVGTAVTVECIDVDGKFLGGLILPGHGIMLRALETGTAGKEDGIGAEDLEFRGTAAGACDQADTRVILICFRRQTCVGNSLFHGQVSIDGGVAHKAHYFAVNEASGIQFDVAPYVAAHP